MTAEVLAAETCSGGWEAHQAHMDINDECQWCGAYRDAAGFHPGEEQSRPLICEWFANCRRPATGVTSHPILGEVPTCDRCAAFATGPREE